jgi:hypothetical protein
VWEPLSDEREAHATEVLSFGIRGRGRKPLSQTRRPARIERARFPDCFLCCDKDSRQPRPDLWLLRHAVRIGGNDSCFLTTCLAHFGSLLSADSLTNDLGHMISARSGKVLRFRPGGVPAKQQRLSFLPASSSTITFPGVPFRRDCEHCASALVLFSV